jgi:ABC-type Na+ efflux pump permease subunit
MDYEFDGVSAFGTKSRPIHWRSWAAVQIVLWLLVAYLLLAVAPRFEQIAREFGLPLTGLSLAILQVSHVLYQFLPLALLLLAVGLAANVLGVRAIAYGSKGPENAASCIGWLTLAPFLVLLTVSFAFVSTFLTILARLSG